MTTPPPEISVVTSVYNGGRFLLPSLESILGQQGAAFEFIVVDDGSTDNTAGILDDVARRDARLRVLHQPNRGLTEALARGCAEARGRFIARHDADDLSLPGRLALEAEMLAAAPGLAFVSSWTHSIGPEDELLFETRRPPDPAEATRQLTRQDNGPYHGSVMFRADAYQRVGGYRPAFRFAQDWDLWLRLAEVGELGYVPRFLYAFRFGDTTIGASRRRQQVLLLRVAQRCAAARARGEAERDLLEEAARISAEAGAGRVRARGDSSYFIGKCLLDRRDRRALPYLARSLRDRPWRWRCWAAFALAWVACDRSRTSREVP